MKLYNFLLLYALLMNKVRRSDVIGHPCIFSLAAKKSGQVLLFYSRAAQGSKETRQTRKLGASLRESCLVVLRTR
ncbi:hypothetical protein, partial [Ferrovibrio sp.]|uniref:hypothetical protein n=1 Tax=Ferrovibrio sp. TaxID=1917215 RepID=UPI00311D39A9